MTDEMQAATPAEVEQTEQGAEVEQTSSEATTEQTQDNEQTQDQEKRTPWFQKRIAEVTREKYEARRQAEQAAAELQQYRELLQQYQQGQQPEPQTVDIEQVAREKAERIVAERSFNDACNRVYTEGKEKFQDFDNAVGNLQMVGVNRDFLELVTESDAAAQLLYHLGQDLDEASRIASLKPAQMARELTKLEYRLSQPAPKPVSKAPAPIKPIGSGKPTESGLSDDLPVDEWLRRRNEQLRRR